MGSVNMLKTNEMQSFNLHSLRLPYSQVVKRSVALFPSSQSFQTDETR